MPIIRSWALTRGFALHPGTRNRYEIRDTRTQHRPPSRQVNDHGRVSGTHRVAPSNLAGRTLADLITGTESERVDLPWVNVRHPRWEPEPLRWLGVRGSRWILAAADSYEFRTNREARTAVALARKLRND